MQKIFVRRILNSPTASLNSGSNLAGIVFNTANISDKVTLDTNFATKFITANISTNTSNMRFKDGTTYTDAVNDQLVIQYNQQRQVGMTVKVKKLQAQIIIFSNVISSEQM